MRLVVGLGNPGKGFVKTRHNIGHLFVDFLSKQKEIRPFPVELCKTTSMMNNSGSEVKDLIKKCKVPFGSLLVVHDDMDLPLGGFKLQLGRSAAGHKGIQSIIGALGTKDFWRLRFGIGTPPPGVGGEDFVLGEFDGEEFALLQQTFAEAFPQVLGWAVSDKGEMGK